MASVTAIYRYADGEAVSVRVKVENDYPDALAEARATAIAGVRELTGIEAPVRRTDVTPSTEAETDG